jgi:subtilisin family serine protease
MDNVFTLHGGVHMKRFLLAALLAVSATAGAVEKTDYLVKMAPGMSGMVALKSFVPQGSKVQSLSFNNWHRVQIPEAAVTSFRPQALLQNKAVLHVQPNYKIRPTESPSLERVRALYQAKKGDGGLPFPIPGEGEGGDDDFPFPWPGEDGGDGEFPFPLPDEGNGGGGGGGGFPLPGDPGNGGGGGSGKVTDNPDFSNGGGGSGTDPHFSKQWGMNQNNVKGAWEKTKGSPDIIVAVLDTGVDYNHEDLVENMWRNPGETGTDAQGKDKSKNGIDDDKNGYVDDVVGWDFAGRDNKPYDMHVTQFTDILNGGNPGHGTHCAGNVAARADNGKGIVGVAPNIKIMALRFISEKGSGTTADAIAAIKYAVDNGAKITSNSWGSEGEDANDPESKALREAIQYAQDKGVLFVAAAGNGHQGRGYDNDRDSRPGVPASYTHDIIISVAAIDERGGLGSFSNWGAKSVDLGAPGVKVFSTIPGNRYQDTIGNFLGQVITWDGTSMATPHVAGAAALYWSAHPDKTWQQVKAAVLAGVKKSSTLGSKTVSGGQLDAANMMKQ